MMTPFFVKGGYMNILNSFSSDLYTGHRVLRVASYEEFKNLHCPYDCEIIAINKNPEINEIYMKQVDNMGNEIPGRYSYKEIPEVKFDPDKYVTHEEFNELKEEIRNGFNSLKSSTNTANNGTTKSGYNNK